MTTSRSTAASPLGQCAATLLMRQRRQTRGFRESLGDGLDLTMLWSPPGSFRMGSAQKEPQRQETEGPQPLMRLQGFFMDQTPITPRSDLKYEPCVG
ncbi:MAG: SUMF1/EgtB/PvdO family nonheme iron enzyme [Cyanobacteriota bacterium]|jgi:formylglycine-generating enzyme required for sulfatase activity